MSRPTARRRLAGIALLAVAATLAACGGGGGSDGGGGGQTAAASSAPSTVSVEQWVGSVCTSVGNWQKKLQQAPDLSNASDLDSTKTAITDFLGSVVSATDTMIGEVKAAGVPDTKDGEAIASALTGALESVNQSFQKAQSDVEGLSTSDPSAFATGLSKVGEDLTTAGSKVGSTFDELATKYPAADLSKAAQNEPACSAITGG